ncbi:MAG: hypothetical protein V4555_11980 [Acidobacteriota bacterium]
MKWSRSFVGVVAVALSAAAMQGQADEHGRKYKAPPPTAHIVVTVQKGFNQKPLMNAAVIFRATRDGHSDGNLEVKTDPNGDAAIDVIELGSHLTVQVIARGFATYSTEFDVDSAKKELLVKLQRPKAQISRYEDNEGKDSDIKPGVQQHVTHTPATTPAPAGTPK